MLRIFPLIEKYTTIFNFKYIMESVLSSDESCDSENTMRHQLTEYGLDEENLSKQEMVDLLKALKYSKSTAKDDELMRQKSKPETGDSHHISLKRRYLNVRDRRLPWSLLPATITPAEKARTLAVYIKLMSMTTYCQARLSVNMAAWPPPLEIVEETTRIQPIRSTRSGRSFPIYAGFDEDSSDLDITVTRPKKRKDSNTENNLDGAHNKKNLSLKRKMSKDENNRPIKELKTVFESSLESNNLQQARVFELED